MQIYIVISATREIELYFNLIDFRVLYVFCPLSVCQTHKNQPILHYTIVLPISIKIVDSHLSSLA